MLHWLQRNTPKRLQLFGKLALFVGGIHGVFLLILFVFYHDGQTVYTFEVAKRLQHIPANSHVLFMPLYKKVGAPKKRIQVASASKKAEPRSQVKSRPKTALSSAKKKNPVVKKRLQVPAKKETPKKITTAQPKKNIDEKKPVETPKAVEQKKEVAPVQPDTKKDVLAENKTAPVADNKGGAASEVIALGQEEYDQLRMASYLQQAVLEQWSPPAGVPHDVWCEISCQINRQGMLQESKVERSSGVLMYDVSARSALARLEFPKWAWGKTVKIAFKQ